MRKLLLILPALFILAGALHGQTTMQRAPDCVIGMTATAAQVAPRSPDPSGTNVAGYRNEKGCVRWTLAYGSSGFSALSIELDQAQDAGNTPGTFAAFPSTASGTQPLTSTTSGQITVYKYYPWVSINLSSVTGTGTVRAVAYGWTAGSGDDSSAAPGASGGGGGGCSSPCTVNQGTSPWVVGGTVTDTQGTSPWIIAGGGVAGTPATGVASVQGVSGGTAVPVSGTVTDNQGTAAASTAGWPTTVGNLAESTGAWTSATSANTAVTVATKGYTTVTVFLVQTTTITGGVATFEATDDGGSTFQAVAGFTTNANGSFPAKVGGTYTFAANTNYVFSFNVASYSQFRVRLSTVITGTGTVNVGVQAAGGISGAMMLVEGGGNAGAQPISLQTNGALLTQNADAAQTLADGTSNSAEQFSDNSGNKINPSVMPMKFNGTTWDRDFTCTNSVAVNISTATTTQLVALSGSTVVRVCGFMLTDTGAVLDTVQFEYGTGTACATGTTAITGAMAIPANATAPLGQSAGVGSIFRGIAANAVCLVTTGATVAVTGYVSYAQF